MAVKEEFTIIKKSVLSSTNDFAERLVEERGENVCRTVIVAEHQTEGRGAGNNKWLSEKSENLTFSLIICPNILPQYQFLISKITSLSLLDYFRAKNISAQIKWANDIFVGGKKISGMLIENSVIADNLSHSIIGIGININQCVFPSDFVATSLRLETGKEYDLQEELSLFLDSFEEWERVLKEGDIQKIDSEYFKNLLGTDKFLRYRDAGGEFEARIKSIDEFGRLVVETTEKEVRIYNFKELSLLM